MTLSVSGLLSAPCGKCVDVSERREDWTLKPNLAHRPPLVCSESTGLTPVLLTPVSLTWAVFLGASHPWVFGALEDGALWGVASDGFLQGFQFRQS